MRMGKAFTAEEHQQGDNNSVYEIILISSPIKIFSANIDEKHNESLSGTLGTYKLLRA